MARIMVPESARPSLEALSRLDSNSLQHLVDALETAPPTLRPQELSDYVASHAPHASRTDLEDIVDNLISLSTVQSTRNFTGQELAHEVAQSSELSIPDNQRELLAERLTALLNARSLMIAAKALDVLFAYERLLDDARIFTDIRPVFLDSPSLTPAGAAIVHTLRLRYHTNGDTRTFTVAMAPADIGNLRAQLDRADAKAKALADIIESAHLHDLQSTGQWHMFPQLIDWEDADGSQRTLLDESNESLKQQRDAGRVHEVRS